MASTNVQTPHYDRAKELKEFDETKAGAKGLADAGIKSIPRIFIHDPENLPRQSDFHDEEFKVPVIDLRGIDEPSRRREIVAEVCEASKSWGFFQLLNHGMPLEVLDGMMQSNRRFHELDVDVKAKFYSRDVSQKVMYFCNFDLHISPAADWRDTFAYSLEGSLVPDELPSVCRVEMQDYMQRGMTLAETLCELLSEALGLHPCYFKDINCTKSQSLGGHYYPPCPEPDLTLGTSKHADPCFLTILLQDDLGGLEVLHRNRWVPVSPIRGALVVNVGDLLQLVSNGKFKSVEHRVLASRQGPRLSVVMFFRPSRDDERLYGPIKEVLSDENPPIYGEILVRDYTRHYGSRALGGDSALNHFKL